MITIKHLLIHENNFISFSSTAFKFPKQIFEPVMPVKIAHNSVHKHDFDNSNTNKRSTRGQNVNSNVLFTHDRSLLNAIDPDMNYIDFIDIIRRNRSMIHLHHNHIHLIIRSIITSYKLYC